MTSWARRHRVGGGGRDHAMPDAGPAHADRFLKGAQVTAVSRPGASTRETVDQPPASPTDAEHLGDPRPHMPAPSTARSSPRRGACFRVADTPYPAVATACRIVGT